MKAMIFAAGIGSRLRPITDTIPKALLPLQQTPLLEIAIRRLLHYGFHEIIINIHHHGQQIIDFLAEKNNFGATIEISDERAALLDTGGGLKKAAHFFGNDPFLLLNADVISNIDLAALYQHHQGSGALATLAVQHRKSPRMLLFNDARQLCGWRNVQNGAEKIARPASPLHEMAFSGIQVVHPGFFRFFPSDQDTFSIIDTYLAAAAHEKILAYPHDEDIWLDVGKPDQIEKAERVLSQVLL